MAQGAQFSFGSGFLYGIPLVTTYTQTPALLGTLQDVTYDISATMKSLYGQLQFPVAQGRGPAKFTGKAKMGSFNAQIWNTFFFGPGVTGTQVPTTTGAILTVNNEVGSPAANTYQFSNHASGTFDTDLGVFYTVTGAYFTKVTAAPAVGQYSVNTATGTYTFAAGDAAANAANGVTVNYTWLPSASTSWLQSINNNQLPMGSAPSFEIVHNVPYITGGTAVTFKIYGAISSKLSFGWKNTDFTVPEIDFEMFANSSGKVMDIVTTVGGLLGS
jgi:hypothetical protein